MCGIAGFWDPSGRIDAEDAARRMADALRHRGPDAGATWRDADAGLALGHRRLSILDLSPLGAQPMASADGALVLVFNGEIYNHAALRAAVTGEGAVLRGHSDTEVLLAAIARWGLRAALERAHGMFAIALWDRRTRALALARDRAGEKPLYFGRAAGGFAFASELKAFAALPGFAPTMSREAVAAFLRFSYVPTPLSIWEGIRKLEPGTIRWISDPVREPDGRAERFWSAATVAAGALADPLPDDDAVLADESERVLRAAVAEQMIADVPLGAFLSGGIDSSLIVALMQAQASRPTRTFTVGFEEAGYDEAADAAAVARHLGTDHTAVRLSAAETREVIPSLPTMYDEPFADSSQVPTHLVARVARRDVTVALSGDGGDEVFAGYTRYFWASRLWQRARPWPSAMRRLAARATEAVPVGAWDALASAASPLLPAPLRVTAAGDKLHKAAGLFRAPTFDAVYDRLVSNWWEAHRAVPGSAAPAARPTWTTDDALPDDTLARMQLRDFVGYLPDDILVKVDRAAMAVSLETRAPFLDARVVALAWRIPPARRTADRRGKYVLRRVLERHVPRALIDRPKKGFEIPVAQWLRGPLRGWAEDLLTPGRVAADGLLDPAPVRALWDAHQAGGRNHAAALWNVLMLQAWRAEWTGR